MSSIAGSGINLTKSVGGSNNSGDSNNDNEDSQFIGTTLSPARFSISTPHKSSRRSSTSMSPRMSSSKKALGGVQERILPRLSAPAMP